MQPKFGFSVYSEEINNCGGSEVNELNRGSGCVTNFMLKRLFFKNGYFSKNELFLSQK